MQTEYVLTKSFKFEAAHQLKFHDGKCARLHGHSFTLTVVLGGDNTTNEHAPDQADVPFNKRKKSANPKSNMLLDYGIISEIVKPFVDEKLDHHFLNETLETDSPTSEYIAEYCFGFLSGEFRDRKGVRLIEIRISETCTSEAIYGYKSNVDFDPMLPELIALLCLKMNIGDNEDLKKVLSEALSK